MKHYSKYISILVVAVVIAACNVSKTTVAPEATLPATFRNDKTTDQGSSNADQPSANADRVKANNTVGDKESGDTATTVYHGALVTKKGKAVIDGNTAKGKAVINIDTAASVNYDTSSIAGGNSIADLSWKQFFTDPVLQQLIDTAIAKNYDMQIAIKNIETAQLLLKQTRWGYTPDISAQVGASSNRPSDNSLNGLSASQFLGTKHIEDFSASVSLSWEADIWGKVKNRQAAAVAGYLQSAEVKKAVQTNLVASISQAYYNLLMLDAQLGIAQKNIRLSDSTLRIMRFQYNSGQVTALAVQQAEAQQNTATALVPQIEKDIVLQENALRVLSAELPAKVNRNTNLAALDIHDTITAGLPAAMVGRRPDVKNQELALTIANAQVGITKANMYPALRITASGGLNSFKASNWFNIPASLFGAVTGGLVQPLLQKKQLKTDFEIAKIRREQTVIGFRQAVLTAVGEVSDALVKIEKLETEQTIVRNRVALLQKATSNARQLFSSGMANYLEVITAQTNVLQSELQLASLTRQRLSARVELYRSLGGGWN